jgi:hypothetical protein
MWLCGVSMVKIFSSNTFMKTSFMIFPKRA